MLLKGKSYSARHTTFILVIVGVLMFSFFLKLQLFIFFRLIFPSLILLLIGLFLFVFEYTYEFKDDYLEIKYLVTKNKNRKIDYLSVKRVVYDHPSPLINTGIVLTVFYVKDSQVQKIIIKLRKYQFDKNELINLLLLLKGKNIPIKLNTYEKEFKERLM